MAAGWLVAKRGGKSRKLSHSDFTLKALTFLVGMLTSMTLTESLDRSVPARFGSRERGTAQERMSKIAVCAHIQEQIMCMTHYRLLLTLSFVSSLIHFVHMSKSRCTVQQAASFEVTN